MSEKPHPDLRVRGFEIYRSWLDSDAQAAMVDDLTKVIAAAPLFSPETPYGKPMSVRMTSTGRFGWFADRRGYRYIERHPSGGEWPPIPASVLAVWSAVTGVARLPDCALVNFYAETARMGMHHDKDEADFQWPVVSISLGDQGLFRIGGSSRGGKTDSIWLTSGDVVVMGGDARLTYHDLDRIRTGSSTLLPDGGRINITLRVVD